LIELVCGIDEAGRGPLVGNVLAGAVILDPLQPIIGLKDSKKLSSVRRDALYDEIMQHALAWGIGSASPEEIDQYNILQASMLAMKRALNHLIIQFKLSPDLVLVDGNRLPELDIKARAIIKGDTKEPSISAASILAKVTRDREMLLMHHQYPDYGFDQHMGYPTKMHLLKLTQHGLIPGYRHSFKPVKELLGHPHA
jgi:ribonuclease HII